MLVDGPNHLVTFRSAETPGTGPQTGSLGAAAMSGCATVFPWPHVKLESVLISWIFSKG